MIYLNMEFVKAQKILYSLTYVNCFLDPFIYAVRMREIQKGRLASFLTLKTHGHWLENRFSDSKFGIDSRRLFSFRSQTFRRRVGPD